MLRNVQTIDKGEKPKYQDSDVYEKSSDIKQFNLFEQDWTDLQAAGLAHLFNDDQTEFERRRGSAEKLQTEGAN